MRLFNRSIQYKEPTLSTRELFKIESKIERETGIRLINSMRSGRDVCIYHGIIPAVAKDEVDRDVFIKILLSNDVNKQNQFERESWLYSHFRHDHLVRKEFSKTLSVGGKFGRIKLIVLEFIDGVSIAQLLDYLALSETYIENDLALEIGIKVLRALKEVHAFKDRNGKPLQIIHADVSPQNILLSRKGQVKLIDFGISRMSEDTFNIKELRAGKPAYMAPEQIFSDDFNHSVDVYALGVVLSELLLSRRLASVNDLEKVRQFELNGCYRDRIHDSGLHGQLKKILLKALEVDPGRRFANANEFILALEKYLHKNQIIFRADGLSKIVNVVLDYLVTSETRQFTGKAIDQTSKSDGELENETPILEIQPIQPKLSLKIILKYLKQSFPYYLGMLVMLVLLIMWKNTAENPVRLGKDTESVVSLVQDEDRNIQIVPEDKISIQAEEKVIKPIIPSPENIQKSTTKNVKVKSDKKVISYGSLFVGASPWAEVTIPGYTTQRPIPFTIKLTEGWHKVTARYQDENGKWQYVAKSVRIDPNVQKKCLAFFDVRKSMNCK